MASTSDLCDFCTEINFDMLRLPTVNEIQLLNAGCRPPDQFPYKFDTSSEVGPSKNLGLVSRVQKSSGTCPFCSAVVEVLQQHPHVLDRLRNVGVVDPLCHVSIFPSGRLRAPEGVSWKPTREDADTDTDFFYLRQLQLGFSPLQPGQRVQPGQLWLVECFQLHHLETPVPQGDGASTRRRQDPDELEHILFGGRERPAMLDPKLLAHWLDDCLTHHTMTCGVTDESASTTRAKPMSLFRLLHVKERKIVDFHNVRPSQLKYTTLSYVWGGSQRTTLQTSNYARLHSAGSLVGQVSKTIEDSFHLTEALGVEYLWADALCIIQDDDADKAAQISNMGIVYSDSLFTIIAAAGSDAEAGLPGVRAPRTALQKEVLVRATDSGTFMSLMMTLNPTEAPYEHYTTGTAWASRGWTMQERVLTQRAIMFLKDQVLWACGQSCWAEEKNSETALARVSWFALHESEFLLNSSLRNWFAFDDEGDQIWYKLRRLVLDYTGRNLTIEGDAFDAFSAILQQVKEKTGEHFLWGIPATRFELGMCWEEDSRAVIRRTCLSTLQMTTLKRRVPFPSWSWLGWKGAISLRVEDRYLELGLDPQILCYIFRNSPPRLVRVSRLSMDNQNIRVAIAIPNSPLTVTLQDVQDQCPDLTPERLTNTPDDQLLFFWTESAHFLVSEPIATTKWRSGVNQPLDGYEIHHRNITDADGNHIGQTTACEGMSNDEVNESGECEFILIANNTPPQHEEQKTVMQIKWLDGIAYRVNLAEVRMDAWNRADLSRKLVALG